MTFDPSADFEAFDGLADASYRVRGERDVLGEAFDITILRRAVTSLEIPAGPAVLNRRAVVFHVLVSEFTEEPKRGDVVIESTGQSWQVYQAEKQTLNTRYRLSCIEQP